MKGLIGLTSKEKENILKQHSQLYDGYSVRSQNNNMYPLTVYDHAKDKEGITLDNNNNPSSYRNHRINEIAAKNLHYDEIEPAYEYESGGPINNNIGYDVYNQTKSAYNFDSKGPVDPFYGGGTQPGSDKVEKKRNFDFDTKDFNEYIKDTTFEDLLDDETLLSKKEEELEELKESFNKTKSMFKKISYGNR